MGTQRGAVWVMLSSGGDDVGCNERALGRLSKNCVGWLGKWVGVCGVIRGGFVRHFDRLF